MALEPILLMLIPAPTIETIVIEQPAPRAHVIRTIDLAPWIDLLLGLAKPLVARAVREYGVVPIVKVRVRLLVWAYHGQDVDILPLLAGAHDGIFVRMRRAPGFPVAAAAEAALLLIVTTDALVTKRALVAHRGPFHDDDPFALVL